MSIWAKNTCLLVTVVVLIAFACYAADDSLYFDVSDTGAGREKGVVVRPWKVVALEGDFGGRWVVAGDIDGGSIARDQHAVAVLVTRGLNKIVVADIDWVRCRGGADIANPARSRGNGVESVVLNQYIPRVRARPGAGQVHRAFTGGPARREPTVANARIGCPLQIHADDGAIRAV